MNGIFLEKLDDFVINQDNGTIRKSIKDFWSENYQHIINSEAFLLSKLQEYTPSNSGDYTGFFYRYLYFFLFKDEDKYYSKKIVDFLKCELIKQSNTEKPEFYSKILSVIFKIEGIKSDEDFYQTQYEHINKKGFLYSDISTSFLEIFIHIGKNNQKVLPEFLGLFQKVIIQSVDEIISSSIQEGWEYLISLEKNVFNDEFLKLITYFNSDDKRGELVHHSRYTSLFTLGKYDDDTKKFSKIKTKIENSFGINEFSIFEDYIISEVSYVLNIYERNIEKNIFISQGIDILQNKNPNFIITLLQKLDSKKNLWGLEDTVAKYLGVEQLDDFINIFKDTEGAFTIFRVYEIIKQNKNVKFIYAFEQSSYKDEIKKIQKQRQENQEKFNKEGKEREEKEKQEFLSMIISLEDGQYFPKLFQDYVEYTSSDNPRISIFSKEEQKKINKELIIQIKTYFSYRKVEEYTQKWIDFVTFEKKEENSYSHCWDVRYMSWFLQIAQILPEVKKILQENYKSILLFYPLIYGDQIEDYLFDEIIPKKIENNDIEYILKVYSCDLHNKAKNLRYYRPRNFVNFYKKFKESFKLYQEKLEEISFNMISEKEHLAVYYREEYLEIYADAVGENKYRKYWNTQKRKYPEFNYFNDILKNVHERDGEELKEMRFFLMIQTVLIEKYVKKTDVVWRIRQFKGVELKYTSKFAREYPHYSGVTSWISEGAFSEIEWSSFDRENFAYIFSLDSVGKIDVSKEILGILKESLKIKFVDDSEQNLYSHYLQKIFFKYFGIFDDTLVKKSFYFKIQQILEKYDFKYYYDFDGDLLKKKFGVKDKEIKEYKIKGKVDKLVKLPTNALKKKLKGLFYDEEEQWKKFSELLFYKKEYKEKYLPLKEQIEHLESNIYLYVEGPSDKTYLDFCYNNNLFNHKFRPSIINSGGCNTLKQSLLLNSRECNGGGIITVGMFDYDLAGVSAYKTVINGRSSKKSNINQGSIKKENKKEIYSFLLPVPNNEIKNQVYYETSIITGKKTGDIENKDFEELALMEIEHLFYGVNIGEDNKIKIDNDLFKKGITVGGGSIIELNISNGSKVLFSEKLIGKNGKKYFSEKVNNKELFINFKPIIDLIDKIASGYFL